MGREEGGAVSLFFTEPASGSVRKTKLYSGVCAAIGLNDTKFIIFAEDIDALKRAWAQVAKIQLNEKAVYPAVLAPKDYADMEEPKNQPTPNNNYES